MKAIGEYLRRIREEKNLSLKEIQETTKIRLIYLEAIERGDFEAIPGEVYRKGFLANYATAIGLNGQEIVDRYNKIKSDFEEQIRVAQAQIEEAGKNQPLVDEQVRAVYTGIAISLIAILIIFSFVFSVFRHRTFAEANSLRAGTEDTDKAQNREALPAPITMEAEFKDSVWVQVKLDGEPLFVLDGMTFTPASTKQVWTAQKEMEVKIGNPLGIRLKLNGRQLEIPGKRNVPTTLRITPNGIISP